MIVGVPKEIKMQEARVGLTPGAAREYVSNGHEVLIETGAGLGVGADDDAYRTVGATIVDCAAEIFRRSGGRTMQLRHNDALSTVDNKRASASHKRNFAHVDFLLFDLFNGRFRDLAV